MDWLNLHSSTLDSAEFVGSEPTQRATWLCLLRYCIGQENDGRIEGCKDWADRRWQQLCRVKLREVAAKCDLWTWEGSALVLWSYPTSQQKAVQANRTNGSLGGRPRVKAADNLTLNQDQSRKEPPGLFPDNQPVQVRENVTEGKGKKGNERKGNIPRKRGGSVAGCCPSEQPEPIQSRMLAINALKHRQSGTFWTAKEFAAFEDAGLAKLPDADFNDQVGPVAEYYAADVSVLRELWRATDPRADFRRRDLLTLLNNWAGEVDRAREWCHWREKKSETAGAARL